MLFFHYVVRKLVRSIGKNASTITVIAFVLSGCMIGVAFLFGLQAAARESLPAETVIVTEKDAISEPISRGMSADTIDAVQVLPGIRTKDGHRLTSLEVVANVALSPELTSSGAQETQVVRGVDPIALEIHNAKLVQGRMASDSASEVVVGAQLRRLDPKITIGTKISLAGESWTVVGVFATGAVFDAEIWVPRGRLSQLLRQDHPNSVTLYANSIEDAATLIKTINDSKRLYATARSERELRGSRAKLQQVTTVILVLVIALCLIGIFITTTNVHASLITRLPEFATLIALGVRRGRVARLVVFESMALAILGVVMGIGLAMLASSRSSAILGSAATFDMKVGFGPIAVGVALGLLVGLLGGLFPAVIVRGVDLRTGLR